MIQGSLAKSQDSAVRASWERCERQHLLSPHVRGPIVRMQAAEIAPRLEQMVERTGGRIGIFRQVAEIAMSAGQCFSVADAEGVLVRVEGSRSQQADYAEDGIAAGSLWDERIAGTNGVSMAMNVMAPFTVRGEEHYFDKFKPFACTSAPLLNADHEMIGIVNLATVDRGNVADYLFARQLLGAAADRIQRALFERQYHDFMLVSVSSPGGGNLLRSNELVAVSEQGVILGSTMGACGLAGLDTPADLVGRFFEALFGADASALDRHPEHVLTVQPVQGSPVHVSRKSDQQDRSSAQGWRPEHMAELAIGSPAMRDACAEALRLFEQSIPFVIEGESGTGKSALICELMRAARSGQGERVLVDCALLADGPEGQDHIRALAGQARVLGLLNDGARISSTLVFENIDEMPPAAQSALRGLLDELEADPKATRPRVVATARRPLVEAVGQGRFRDDLYYLLTAGMISLPPLRLRDRPDLLAEHVAQEITGRRVAFSTDAREAIALHPWPGNVREMRNVLRQTLAGANGTAIAVADLERSPSFLAGATRPAGDPSGAASSEPADERSRLLRALTLTRWNVSQAARELGIGRATINRKIRQHGLERPE